MTSCVFCGAAAVSPTNEHVVPAWARRAFDVQGSLTIYAGERTEDPARRRVAGRPSLTITLKDTICEKCNNGPLSRLETAVQRVLTPMMLTAESIVLDTETQQLLATWAVKTAFLLELAIRQHYPDSRPILGYRASEAEFAWLWAKHTPPPRSLVWLGCWDCQRTSPLMYEPSGAPVPTRDAFPLHGHLTTFTFGYVAFQVFTVDFVAAEEHTAVAWNTKVPPSIEASLLRIWPYPVEAATWPPHPFADDEWARLVTWDGVLRPDSTQRP